MHIHRYSTKWGKRESSEINFLNAPKSDCELLKNEFKYYIYHGSY